MNTKEGAAYDHWLTTPPSNCEDDGHDWVFLGRDSEGNSCYRCRRCGMEDDG